MKVKDVVAKLLTYDQEAEVVGGDYYYDCKEGYMKLESTDFISDFDLSFPTWCGFVMIDTNHYPRTKKYDFEK